MLGYGLGEACYASVALGQRLGQAGNLLTQMAFDIMENNYCVLKVFLRCHPSRILTTLSSKTPKIVVIADLHLLLSVTRFLANREIAFKLRGEVIYPIYWRSKRCARRCERSPGRTGQWTVEMAMPHLVGA